MVIIAPPKRKPPLGRGLDPRRSVRIRGLLLRRFGFGVFAAEALDAAGGVDQLLLAGEEWMAARADFNADVALMGGAGHKRIAARAVHTDFVIGRMNCCFHNSFTPGLNLDSDHLILPDLQRIQQSRSTSGPGLDLQQGKDFGHRERRETAQRPRRLVVILELGRGVSAAWGTI